jgi:hypothetical protein
VAIVDSGFLTGGPGGLFSSGGPSLGTTAGAASDLFSGIGSVVSGFAGAAGSKAAATEYGYAAQTTKEAAAIEELQAQRQITQTLGQNRAAVASNGFQLGGSAADLLRQSAAQGALTKGAISLQGAAQEQAYLQQQKSAKSAGTGQLVGGILGGLGAIAGLF